MKIEIKNRWTGKTVHECEAETLRAAVINAVRDLVPLAGADLAAKCSTAFNNAEIGVIRGTG